MSNVIKIEANPYKTYSGVYKGKKVTFKQRLKEIDQKKALNKIKAAAKKTFGHTDYRKTGMFR